MRYLCLVITLGLCGFVIGTVLGDQISSPPLRHADDTRSGFRWAPGYALLPQAIQLSIRVEQQHRAEPNPWEVAWVVMGDERRFVGFVPKPQGWHLEIFDARRPRGHQQRFLASGAWPQFAIGEWHQLTMIAWDGGVFVVARDLLLDWRWSDAEPAPDWWAEAMRAGVYVEDCTAAIKWSGKEQQ